MKTLYNNVPRVHGLEIQLFVTRFLRAFIDDNILLLDNRLDVISIINDNMSESTLSKSTAQVT